jgi:tRNA G18 (ribose-2'-O)-methylase SpoU
MTGDVESLNAGVAGSVLMFEVVRQRIFEERGVPHA